VVRVEVQLFARLRELCDGRAEIALSLPDGADVATCFDELCTAYGALREHESGLAVAVNEEYADWQTQLRAGDRVAFIPPVSGG